MVIPVATILEKLINKSTLLDQTLLKKEIPTKHEEVMGLQLAGHFCPPDTFAVTQTIFASNDPEYVEASMHSC